MFQSSNRKQAFAGVLSERCSSASVKVQSVAGHSVTDQFALKEPENDTTVCAHHRHTAQLCRKYLKLCVRSMPLCCFISNLLIYFPLTESAREIRGVAVELRDTGSSAAPCGICTHTHTVPQSCVSTVLASPPRGVGSSCGRLAVELKNVPEKHSERKKLNRRQLWIMETRI